MNGERTAQVLGKALAAVRRGTVLHGWGRSVVGGERCACEPAEGPDPLDGRAGEEAVRAECQLGAADGIVDGALVGAQVGVDVGTHDGLLLGELVGRLVGVLDGCDVGIKLGTADGTLEGTRLLSMQARCLPYLGSLHGEHIVRCCCGAAVALFADL